MVRAKFTVQSITRHAWSETAHTVKFAVEYDQKGIPEDQQFAKASPAGEIVMTVDNPPALEQLQLGKKFYVDFTPVEG